MTPKAVYLGDTGLNQQAAYLAGVMTHYGLTFEYRNSDGPFDEALLSSEYGLMILSDYPASCFTDDQLAAIAEKVRCGMGLLMIGGWESFTGLGGNYHRTRLAEVLPVRMRSSDDRVNFSSPCLMVKEQDHPMLGSLPFDRCCPAVGGLNAVEVKPGAAVLLSAVPFAASRNDGVFQFRQGSAYPLLVIGEYGRGRTAAFMSDVAPHWVGPFVDWGDCRLKAQADGAWEIEVGNWYAEFLANVIKGLCIDTPTV